MNLNRRVRGNASMRRTMLTNSRRVRWLQERGQFSKSGQYAERFTSGTGAVVRVTVKVFVLNPFAPWN